MKFDRAVLNDRWTAVSKTMEDLKDEHKWNRTKLLSEQCTNE